MTETVENTSHKNEDAGLISCTKHHYEVTRQDLPLSCPMPDMRLWDGHPRVYLPIIKTGKATCPYCNANYVLIDAET